MVTIICPVFNESKFIAGVINFCVKALPTSKEIIFIDGASTDDTCAIIQSYQQHNPNIILLHNSNRYVPFAMNMAIKQAIGDYIIRLDAHTIYADDYFEAVLKTFDTTGAEIVGGPMRIANGSPLQNAIGFATSNVFGIGNSSFHFADFEGYTDSVYLGAWKKTIFNTTGLFDEALVRNQDDEFHYRAKSLGFKIYQSPNIQSYYFPRHSYSTLFKQYYQYGFYKPLVLQKIKSAVRLRHIIPTLLVLYLLSLPIWILLDWYIMFVPLVLYIVLNIFFSLSAKQGIVQAARIAVSYSTLHVAYGWGFIRGMINLLFKKEK